MGKTEQNLLLSILRSYSKANKKNIIYRPDLDWEKFFQLAEEHKVFPIIYKSLKSNIPSEFIQLSKSCDFHNRLNTFYKVKELRQIIKEADKKGIDIILIKGLSLSALIYNDIYLRVSGDIDILVNEEDIPVMEKIMFILGFSRKFDSSDPQISEQYSEMVLEDRTPTIYNASYDNHEVNYFKNINKQVEIHVEIKRATSSISKNYIHDFLRSTQTISIDDFEVKTLDTTYTLIHLFSNTYHNTEYSLFWGKNINLRDYYDTYNFLVKYYKDIDLEFFSNLCSRYRISQKVIYILENLTDLFTDNIFEEIINLIKRKKAKSYSSKTFVQWENSFLDRLFSNEIDIVHDFNRLYKKRCYSSQNKNYYNRYYLSESQYIKLEDKKNGRYSLDYKFSFELNRLTLTIQLSKDLARKIDKFIILWRLIDNGTNKEVINKDFFINKVDNKVISKFSERNFIKGTSNSFPEKELEIFKNKNGVTEMRLDYLLDELFIDVNKSNNLLCYNIILLEEVLPEMHQLIGTQFSDFNIGIMQFP